MRYPKPESYIGFDEATYKSEASVIQQRVDVRTSKGKSVTSDVVWQWIKERKPGWAELDWEKVFQLVRLG